MSEQQQAQLPQPFLAREMLLFTSSFIQEPVSHDKTESLKQEVSKSYHIDSDMLKIASHAEKWSDEIDKFFFSPVLPAAGRIEHSGNLQEAKP